MRTARSPRCRARIVADTGAYASLGGPVLQRACTHAAGPYQIENVDIEGRADLHQQHSFRRVSRLWRDANLLRDGEQSESAREAWLASLRGRFAYRNAIEPGGVLSNGQIADEGTALKETLLAVKDVIDAHPDAGIACAFKNTGKGVGVKDVGRVKLKVENGGVIIMTSAACMGQGIATVLLQIVAQSTGTREVSDQSACAGYRS